MNNALTYKGYTAKVSFDPRDNIFWGKVLAITDSITFEGETVAELTLDFHNAIDSYIKDGSNTGRKAQKPASGKLMLRVPPELHGQALIAAQADGKSLNQWATEILKEAIHV
jgi:predicted HicB family RNase H-like nuclease